MNPRLQRLQPYPFERLAKLHAGLTPPAGMRPINLSIGEPQHTTPPLILEALAKYSAGYAKYPVTRGELALREAMCAWLTRRYGVSVAADQHVLPLLGSREGLFSLTQAVIDPDDRGAIVIAPNPFYQIYEGAALLAGATPYYVNLTPANGFAADWASVPAEIWQRTRLVFTCSPNNPTGRVMPLAEWKLLFDLADRHGFVIVSDECYSEIYFDEAAPPLGALAAAKALGRDDFGRLIVMGSLSKRSNAPGLRSGFAAGDARIIKSFLLYRTYHGSAMSVPTQMASIVAWGDEAHVIENRRLYAEKFAGFYARLKDARLKGVAPISMPDAAFYFWLKAPYDDAEFSRDVLKHAGIVCLPGSYLSRTAYNINPGQGFVRLALVSTVADALEGADRLAHFFENIGHTAATLS
jgi:N-succinyldiaminopimelate aminotransferase